MSETKCPNCGLEGVGMEEWWEGMRVLLLPKEEGETAQRAHMIGGPQCRERQIAAATERAEKAEAACAAMQLAINAVADLINNSRGVCGLHLNDHEAPWSELQTGGRFEEWLLAFDAVAQ